LGAGLTTQLCRKIIVPKSKEVKGGCSNSQEWKNPAESSKEGLKKGCFPTMMMMMMMMIVYDMTLYTVY
jgi:hypothetical protein